MFKSLNRKNSFAGWRAADSPVRARPCLVSFLPLAFQLVLPSQAVTTVCSTPGYSSTSDPPLIHLWSWSHWVHKLLFSFIQANSPRLAKHVETDRLLQKHNPKPPNLRSLVSLVVLYFGKCFGEFGLWFRSKGVDSGLNKIWTLNLIPTTLTPHLATNLLLHNFVV